MPNFTKSPFNKDLHTYSEENAYWMEPKFATLYKGRYRSP